MEHCVILSACPVGRAMRQYLRPDSFVIACDAGYRNARALGVRPNLVVGDFDSAPPPRRRPQTVVLPHVKDDTDTHYAARWALQQGARQVVLLGALGGRRIEHTMANFATGLFLQRGGAQALLADEQSEARFLLAGGTLCLPRGPWQYFSLFPLEGEALGVTVEGAAYPLRGAALRPDYPVGVSNEWEVPEVRISLQQGSMAVICTRPD